MISDTWLGGVLDRAGQAQIREDRGSELADERPDVAELATKEVAEQAELGRGEGRIAGQVPLHDLHLEGRVGERLGGAVVDLPGEAGPFGLLGLHDPHLHLGAEAEPPGSETSDASSRLRNSQTLSRLLMASSRRASSAASAPEVRAAIASSRRRARMRASAAPASAAIGADLGSAVRRDAAGAGRSRRSGSGRVPVAAAVAAAAVAAAFGRRGRGRVRGPAIDDRQLVPEALPVADLVALVLAVPVADGSGARSRCRSPRPAPRP